MAFFIKKENKPLEAKQLTEHNRDEVMEWCLGKKGIDGSILLKTPESNGQTKWAVCGDFIFKDYTESLGWHFWPVKSDWVEQNYEKIKD